MKNYTIDANLLDWVIKAIAKAEAENVYNGCVVPDFGKNCLKRLYEVRGEQ